MSNYWQSKANWMFGPTPDDPLDLALRAVTELQTGELSESEAWQYLWDIQNCLSEYPSTGMARLEITEEELAQWREKYK